MNKYSDITRRNLSKNLRNSMKINDQVSGHFSPRAKLHSSNSGISLSPVVSPRSPDRFSMQFGSGISSISVVQNQKLMGYGKFEATQELSLRLPEIICKSPSDKDFTILIDKLNEITTPKNQISEIVISEGEALEFSLSEKTYQCYQLLSKGKKCPASFKIKVFYGDIKKFVSTTDNQPGISGNFQEFNGSKFEVYEKSHKFTCNSIYLGIKSYTNSSFKIFATFYSGKASKLILKKEKSELSYESDGNNSVDKYKATSKNYISKNKELKLYSYLKSPNEIQIKAQLWKIKREKVLKKRNIQLQEKKNKAIGILSKRVKKMEIQAAEQEKIGKFQETQNFCRSWLIIIYKINSVQVIKEVIAARRLEILQKMMFNQKVIKVQRFYKKRVTTNGRAAFESVITRSLMLYRNIILPITLLTSKAQLISTIRESANNRLFAIKTHAFVAKIILIQREYRKNMLKHKTKIRYLKLQWTRCIDKYLFTLKKSSKRKERIKYVSIPISTRDAVLEEFYYSRLKEFYRMKVMILRENKLHVSNLRKFPEFDYIPPDAIIDNLIQRCINRKKR